jgi:hypothetical protein
MKNIVCKVLMKTKGKAARKEVRSCIADVFIK